MRLLLLANSASARSLAAALEVHHFAVDLASPAETALGSRLMDYQVVILDFDEPMLNSLNGHALLRRWRGDGWGGWVVALKTSSTATDRVAAFHAGVDDFLAHPVDGEELAVRIEALMRRGGKYSPVLHVADLELDPMKRTVRRGDRTIVLTAREFDLLEFLVRNREQPLTRARIIRHVWNHTFDGLTNVVDVYIAYLRRKIDDGFALKLIRTERGVGYVVREPIGAVRPSSVALSRG